MKLLPMLVRLCCTLFFESVLITASAQKALVSAKLKRINLERPVEIILRLNSPVPQAEYRLIVESQLVAHLDSFSLWSLLRYPKVYFAALYPSSCNGHQLLPPVTQGAGLYPFNNRKINVKKLSRNQLYTKNESAKPYNNWLVRKSPSDFGISSKVNTLPGVDSVQVLYIMK